MHGFEKPTVLRCRNQAAFDPLKYLRAVAQTVLDRGGLIFADSAAVKIEELETGVRVTTDNGSSVSAAQAIFATNVPINNRVEIHSKMTHIALTRRRSTWPTACRTEAWSRKLMPSLGSEVQRWSGQVMDTLDHCASIGRKTQAANASWS